MPTSTRLGQRAAARAKAEGAPLALGLEEELSFGSDEDLMETIGEIDVPPAPAADQHDTGTKSTPVNASMNSLRRTAGKSSKASSLSLRPNKNKVSENSLASSTHLLPPLPPVPAGSMLDLPSEMFGNQEREDGSIGSQKQKRGSLMGTFKVKSLRKWKDDHSSKSSFFSTESQSPQTSSLSLAKMGSNTSSRPSLASSYAQTPVTPGFAAPQLAHLNHSRSSYELPLKGFSNGPLHDIYSRQQPLYEASLDNSSITTDNSAQAETPPVTASKARASPSWYRSELSTAILPEFPATSSQLQPITVLAVPASFRQVTSSFGGLSQSRWAPCTLVFTRFKISVDEEPRQNGASERSVAHIHVLSAPSAQQHRALANISSIGSLRRPTKGNAQAFKPETNTRQELERRLLTRFTSAEISRDYAYSEGRDLALRVLFGECVDGTKSSDEWQLEIKDMSQLKECVNTIKKSAIMINAEELGYGHAIRSAFESPAVSADELAQKLSIHARAVASRREQKMPEAAPEPPSESFRGLKLQNSPSSSASQELGRRDSIDAALGAAIPRSRSAEDIRSPPPATSTLPVIEDTLNCPESPAFNFASALEFPAPPSDLPPRRRVRAMAAPGSQLPNQPSPDVNIVAPEFEDATARPPTPPRSRSPSMSSSKRTLTAHDNHAKGTLSISSNNSGSSTSKLRRLRGKPVVMDIMTEFSAIEAENMPPAPEEEEPEPIRDDRTRKIRFAQG